MPDTFRVTVEPFGREVDCRPDQTLLDACLRAGIWVPHSCTHGTCGTCKVEVLDGEVDHGDASAFALMDFERDDGKALLCCATPRSDLTFEADVDVEDDLPAHPVDDYTGTVRSIEDVAVDIRRVRVELDRDLAFDAGQYLAWHLPGGPAEGRAAGGTPNRRGGSAGERSGVTRNYSMANPPSQPRQLEFQIRRVPGGVCSDGWVFGASGPALEVGDRVALTGPYGRFTVRAARTEPAVLIAGGTGLAPIAAMVKHVLGGGLGPDRGPSRMTLYQGARTRDTLYDVELFTRLEAEHPDRFRYLPCLSEESAPGFASGLVTEVLAAEPEQLSGHVAYVCGPPPMVDAALKALMAKRLFPRDVYREEFVNAADRAGGLRSPLIRR